MGLLNVQNNGIIKMEDVNRIEKGETILDKVTPCTD